MLNWKPEARWTQEDRLLVSYWTEIGGLLFTEVTLGSGERWPKGAISRRFDALRFPSIQSNQMVVFQASTQRERVDTLIETCLVEIIEVKQRLNRLVIGQAIVGHDMLEIGYGDINAQSVVVCQQSDPLMELVCQRRNIKVWKPDQYRIPQ